MIEITVKAESGMGKNTIASYIAKALHDMGADVIVDNVDEIGHQYLHKERLQSVFGRNVTISISTELKPRNGKVNAKVLHKAGYAVRVTSWENDGDNYKTVDCHIGEKEKLGVVIKFANLFRSKNNNPAGIGNLLHDEIHESNYDLVTFYEQHMPWFCTDIDLDGVTDEDEENEIIGECMLDFARNLGLSGNSEYFATRVLQKIEVLYFETDVVCTDVSAEFQL